jgi:hypothetical protein
MKLHLEGETMNRSTRGGLETCSLCGQDAAKAEGRAVKAAIVFHTCGRDNP